MKLCRIVVPAAAILCLSAAPGASGQAIAGRVVDASTGAGIPQVRVEVLDSAAARAAPVVTDADGRFLIALPSAGRYRLQAGRLAYETGRTRPVKVGEHDTARVTVRLREAVVELNGVTATVRGRRIPVKGVFRVAAEAPSATDHVSVTAGERSLVARGKLPTPTLCYQLAGAAVRSGQLLTLVVEARPNGDICGASAGTAFTYRMTVKRLQAGTYALRVLHAFRGAATEPTVALDTTVTVQ
jgi:hypothetical protein